ncbi:MAG: hypothetical protein EP347_05560 [Alphaproteobacteria bacterium]|nr:MAG: hypothetical protein EP347_05560 [Alphaproteobacteria bacterium]
MSYVVQRWGARRIPSAILSIFSVLFICFATNSALAQTNFVESKGPPGYKCEFWLMQDDGVKGDAIHLIEHYFNKSRYALVQKALDYEGISYKMRETGFWVPCYIYQDIDFIVSVSNLVLDERNHRKLEHDLALHFEVSESGGPPGMKCEFWFEEADVQHRYPLFMSRARFSPREIGVIVASFRKHKVPHEVDNNRVWVPCYLFQSIDFFLNETNWVLDPGTRAKITTIE